MKSALVALLFLFALRSSLPAQTEPGSELTVILLTYETGGRVWERFGHNALLIHDGATGSATHYDYGRFDFASKNFFLKFAKGEMQYSMGMDDDPDRYIRSYAADGRKIWAQELDLPPAARRELRDFLAWNIRPENAAYAYDYYLDNCSTRIRDALDKATGGAIRRYAEQPSGFTWRDETRRLDEHNAALYTGLLLGLGHPVDREMSRWEQMFLPIRLREHLDSVRIAGPDGTLHPLVRNERVLAEGGRWPVPARPTSWLWKYLLAGGVLGGLLLWTGRKHRGAFLAVATLWALLGGMAGLVLTLLAASRHRAAHYNENLLLFNLLVLLLALLIPAAVRREGRTRTFARRLALLVAALAALDLLLKLVPGFGQHNLELIALALPVHTAVWLGLRDSGPS